MEKDELTEEELESVVAYPVSSDKFPENLKAKFKEVVRNKDELNEKELESVAAYPLPANKIPEDLKGSVKKQDELTEEELENVLGGITKRK